MNKIADSAVLFILIFLAASVSFGQSAGASPIYDVKFVKGRFVTRGSVAPPPCTPDSPTECGESGLTFSMRGHRDDRIRIVLNPLAENARARFSIETPRRNPMQKGYTGGSWTGTLRSSGDYLIYVWIEKGSTPFTLTVTRN